MPFDAADLAAFLDPTMPGYRQATIGEVTIDGLFRKPYAESFGMIASDNPSYRCLTAHVSWVLPGDDIVIDGTTYTVASVRPDGAGMTVLDLK